MSIDSDKTGCFSSSGSSEGREGYQPQVHAPQGPLGNVSSPLFGGRQVEPWTFSTLPPDVVNYIFGFWIGSVADVCTARLISREINESLLSRSYSPYRVFMERIPLFLNEPNYHDSAMTIELIREKDGLRHPLNLNGFEPNKRSFFNYIRICKIARDLIDQMENPNDKIKALMKLQRLLPGIDMLENAKGLLSQVHLNPTDALIEILATHPNQEVLEGQETRIVRLFHNLKEIRDDLWPKLQNILDILINTIKIEDFQDWRDELVQKHTDFKMLSITVPVLKSIIKSYLRAKRIADAQEFLNFGFLLRNKPRLHAKIMLELIDEFLQIEKIEIAESLRDQITEPFAKAYSQLKIVKKSLHELATAKIHLMKAYGDYCGERTFLRTPQNDWLTMKIVQAFLMLKDFDKAREFRNQLEGRFQQFQAQLEILKVDPSRDEFNFARDLALSMDEKDILLTQLITEYLKTKGLEKLFRAIEVRDLITNPYYKIKVQILIIKASESEDGYSIAKNEMNKFMESLEQGAESRDYWLQIQEHREELSHFQEIMSLCDPFKKQEITYPNDPVKRMVMDIKAKEKDRNQELRRELMAGDRDELEQDLQKALMQELQEELMSVYIQKNDIASAMNLAPEMIIDKLQCRDNCILNLIDELLKREMLLEAKNLLSQLPGSSFFKALAQIRIAKASPNKWEEELAAARAIIKDIPIVDDFTCPFVKDFRCLLNKKSSYLSEGFYDNGYDISESVDGYVYATFNLIAAYIERAFKDPKILETAKMLLSEIHHMVEVEEVEGVEEGVDFFESFDEMMKSLSQRPMVMPMNTPGLPSGIVPGTRVPVPGLDGKPDGGREIVVGPAAEPKEEIFCRSVNDMSHLKENLLNKFLKSKDFQSAETLIGLIPNPKLKFEALTRLIEAMFKRGA